MLDTLAEFLEIARDSARAARVAAVSMSTGSVPKWSSNSLASCSAGTSASGGDPLAARIWSKSERLNRKANGDARELGHQTEEIRPAIRKPLHDGLERGPAAKKSARRARARTYGHRPSREPERRVGLRHVVEIANTKAGVRGCTAFAFESVTWTASWPGCDRHVPARAHVAHGGGHVERAEPIDAGRNGSEPCP